MSRAELEFLRDKLAKATGPDRELDCYLAAAFRYCGPVTVVGEPTYHSNRFFCRPTGFEGDWIGFDLLNNSERYTASIDAAVTLVPEGMWWLADASAVPAVAFQDINYRLTAETHAQTVPLAFCLARIEYELAKVPA